MQGAQVRSLAGELRSHMLQGTAKIIFKKPKETVGDVQVQIGHVRKYGNTWERTKREIQEIKNKKHRAFPGGAVVKNPPANAGDTGSSPSPGRSHMPWSN